MSSGLYYYDLSEILPRNWFFYYKLTRQGRLNVK